MGRRPEGPKVVWRHGYGHARFTHQGRRYFIATGKKDPGEAQDEAHRLYAEVLAGRRRRIGSALRSRLPLDKLFSEWLAALSGVLDEQTVATYVTTYVPRFTRAFKRFDAIDEASIDEHARDRLRCVLRKTVQKELGALRGFLRWCKMEGYLDELPRFPEFPKTAKGKRSGRQRAKPNKLTEQQVVAVILHLPMLSPRVAKGDRQRFAIRPRFMVAYETGLRPGTLDALELGTHWTRGTGLLRIDDEDDKTRYGRELTLTAVAVEALEYVVRELHLEDGDRLFGEHDYRVHVARAGAAAGVPKLAPYDLRHARGTHMADRGAAMPGIAYQLGHTQLTTTNKYAHPTKRAGDAALAAGGADLSGAIPDREGP